MGFKVAIVGRPNVGKSTLFNRLIGRRVAIVHDRPGVTRDRREGKGGISDMTFTLIDTAGLEDANDDSIEGRMRAQTEHAITEADVVLFLIDARAGVTPLDAFFADHLRKSPTPVILVANKCEGKAGAPGLYESYGLGLGDPVPFSAEHGEGLDGLYEALLPHAKRHDGLDVIEDDPEVDPWAAPAEDEIEDGDVRAAAEQAEAQRPLQMAVVGRPNVGKSTIVNRLLGEDRMLTGPEAGLTRDAIASEWEFRGRTIRLVDTAGLRRRANVSDSVEKLSTSNTIEAIRMAQVVVLVMDANAILDKQDLTIARLVIDEGRALVIAVNKWDVVENRAEAQQRLSDRLATSLPQVRGVPTVTMSALAGRGLDQLMNAVVDIYDMWNRRVPTAQLNRWLAEMTERHPPPAVMGGRRIRLRYMTQVRTRPPTFAVFTQRADELPESYSRYLVNGLRESFGLVGVPIRFGLRKRRNPYADD
ncbi:ribosome biogenesis GTPase Der [Telmatospirillum sp.]|uniref:ribosome biogenesis GTPase Der n=1 Tax=Telmatospirillum sp. TaxID=2079197 RepID=UPI002849D789|nr:ribosome biogenesis GTPase Der [Telmatospirillum sp.]MDR3440860.1 ribosome biogenesis GTPase Der [Telmatospirillum sp.]